MPQPVFNLNWYDLNGDRPYPLDDGSLLSDSLGTPLPSDLLVDAQLRFPWEWAKIAFCSAVMLGPRLLSISVAGAPSLEAPSSSFIALGVVTLRQPVVPHRPYAVKPFLPGFGGWLVFGRLVEEALDWQHPRIWKFTTPQQARFAPRAARPFRLPYVLGLGRFGHRQVLTGAVHFQAEGDLEIVRECVKIPDYALHAETYPECAGETAEAQGRQPAIVFRLKPRFNAPIQSVLEAYSGNWLRNPEQNNCEGLGPIEQINGVQPDCCGRIFLEFRGCVSARMAGGDHRLAHSIRPLLDTTGELNPEALSGRRSASLVRLLSVRLGEGAVLTLPFEKLVVSVVRESETAEDPTTAIIRVAKVPLAHGRLGSGSTPVSVLYEGPPAPWGQWTEITPELQLFFDLETDVPGRPLFLRNNFWLIYLVAVNYDILDENYVRHYPSALDYAHRTLRSIGALLLGCGINRRALCATHRRYLPDESGRLPLERELPCLSASASDELSESPQPPPVLGSCSGTQSSLWYSDFGTVIDPSVADSVSGAFQILNTNAVPSGGILTSTAPAAGSDIHLWLLNTTLGNACRQVAMRARVNTQVYSVWKHMRVVACAWRPPTQVGYLYATAELDWTGRFGHPALRVGGGGLRDQRPQPYELVELPEFIPGAEWYLALQIFPVLEDANPVPTRLGLKGIAITLANGGISVETEVVFYDLPAGMPPDQGRCGLGADRCCIDVFEFAVSTL